MFLVRDWWTAGDTYVSWVVDDMRTAYDEYSGTNPSSASEFAGKLVLVRKVSSVSSSSSPSSSAVATLPEASIWGIPTSSPDDLVIDFGIEGHTGAWGLVVSADAPNPDTDLGALIHDDGEVYVGMLSDINSGILNLSMLEVFPSTRNMPDPYWELSGEDLYLTGATQ